jgi:hypothetical protein
MTAIAAALSALAALGKGDATAAGAALSRAQGEPRPPERRDRQIIEIAALVVAGDRARAAGLALEHVAEFPDDRDLLLGVACAAR